MTLSNVKKIFSGLLSDERIVDSESECLKYGSDWTRRPGRAGVVLFPMTTDEVAKILRTCQSKKLAVIPSGGRTGLSGGAVANGEVVLCLEKMRRVDAVDLVSRSVRVQSGVTTQEVHEHCEPHGLMYPIDLAAKGSSQIGGNLSTNAGGIRVIRYGMARKWVLGLQAVTMSGEVLELNRGLEKNNTGYDLVQLLVGSEGTLAVITEATLKLTRIPKTKNLFLFSVQNLETISELFKSASIGPFELLAFEFFSAKAQMAVKEQLGRDTRLARSGNFFCLIEIEPRDGESGRASLDEWLESALSIDGILDARYAESSEDVYLTWALREGITESLQSISKKIIKYDASVPVSEMVNFLRDVERRVDSQKYHFDLYLFGHFGDGSPHLNLALPPQGNLAQFDSDCEKFSDELFSLLKSYGGSLSAEHGAGLLKKKWVVFARTPEEMRIFRGIKRTFDPDGLLNPGKMFDLA